MTTLNCVSALFLRQFFLSLTAQTIPQSTYEYIFYKHGGLAEGESFQALVPIEWSYTNYCIAVFNTITILPGTVIYSFGNFVLEKPKG